MFKRPNYSIPEEQMQAALQRVAKTFDLAWLTAAGNNALQKLWARGDMTSTLELMALADSIEVMRTLDANWLKGQVKLAKSDQENSVRGALFEIFALSMLHSASHQVTPARQNQPGFDGLLTGLDGKQLRVSIKHYGGSRRLREFEENAAAVEQQMLTLIKQSGYPPCQMVLDFSDKYPSEKEWKLLRDGVAPWFQTHKFDASPVFGYVEPIDQTQPVGPGNTRSLFLLMLGRFNGQHLLDLHPAFTSYSFIASSVYHPNEVLNFYSKLDEGCHNLSKHAALETPDIANLLFVHLPETVTLAQAEEWVQTYFVERPNKPISGVFLYQPLTVHNQEQKSVITHGFKICLKPGGMIETHFKTPFDISVPLGHFSSESPTYTLMADAGSGKPQSFTLTDRYVYQQGHHYHRMKAGNGSLMGSLSSKAGVHEHIIMDTQQMSAEMGVASGAGPQFFALRVRHPQVDTLLIM